MRNLLVRGNSTMPTSVGIFNIPAEVTCTPSPWCQKHCYASKGRFVWTSIMQAHYSRYEFSHKNAFVGRMRREIQGNKSIQYVRIHISGDFYSREYVLRWARIAEECPKVIFRTNTRRRDLMPLMAECFPKNLIVRESTDPTRRSIGFFPQAAIPGTPGSERFFECRNNCGECEFRCWKRPKLNIRMAKVL